MNKAKEEKGTKKKRLGSTLNLALDQSFLFFNR